MTSIDWRTVFLLPPHRRFSAAELQRAQPEGLSPTLRWAVGVNLALPLAAWLLLGSPRHPPLFSLVLVVYVLALVAAGMQAWRDPGSRASRAVYLGSPVLAFGAATALRQAGVERSAVLALAMFAVLCTLVLWFAIVHRHQYIVMRLNELDERERAVEMARRLSAAQLEPHFLFNTLASLQHWVQTKDDRAEAMLEALTGYLRATLPMFKRPTQPLGDELEAVRRYLQVMQARLGDRLHFAVDVPPDLGAWPVPPGILLTLVENAVEHGIEPQLAGGRVTVQGRRDRAALVLEVIDDGAGPPPAMVDGLGLTNIRERLALMYGGQASLAIERAPAGGAVARVRMAAAPT